MSHHAYPLSLFDVRAYIIEGNLEAARNLVVNQPCRWKNWLRPDEIQALRAAGTPEEALDGPKPAPRVPWAQPEPRRR